MSHPIVAKPSKAAFAKFVADYNASKRTDPIGDAFLKSMLSCIVDPTLSSITDHDEAIQYIERNYLAHE